MPSTKPAGQAYSAANPMPFIDLAAQQARLRPKIEAAIKRVLDHGSYILGPEVAEAETALAEVAGTRHCVTTSSGTDALLLGLLALGVKAGQGVIVPSFTFAATAEVMPWLGAVPVFAEVDGRNFNLDPARIADALAGAEAAGVEVAGILGVGLFGQPADMAGLGAVAAEHGLWLMDDAAQSLGSMRDGRKTGQLAPITATSFFPAKPLGCYGDGGAVFTDDAAMAGLMRSLRVHGMGADRYQHDRIGMTGRMDSIQAAVLLQKLTIFADEMAGRQRVAKGYAEAITAGLAAALADDKAAGMVAADMLPRVDKGATSAWAQYTIRLPVGADRAAAQAELKAAGIPTAIYYPKGMHQQPPYQHYPLAKGGLPVTADLCSRVLALPFHPYLDGAAQAHVAQVLAGALVKQGVAG